MGSESQSGRDLMAAIQALGEQGLGIEGIHVHVRDRPPVEQHWVADLRRDIFSASKTFASVAVGIAQAEGLLDVDDLVLSHLEHLTPDPSPGVEGITIRHLVTMSSGISYRWQDPDADHPGDPASDILSKPSPTGARAPICSAASSTPARVRTCATSCSQGCSPRSVLRTRSGFAARLATPSVRSVSSCGPKRSPGSAAPCSKTAAAATDS
jgi:hypothetical protein